MDEHPGDVFEDVQPADGEELERDETYVPGDPEAVVDLAAGQGSEADRLGGDDDLPGDPPPDPLAEPEERSAGEPEPAAETPTPAPAPEPEPEPAPPAPAPAPEPEPEPAPAPEPAAEPAAPAPEPTPAPTPTPAPKPAKAEKGSKGNDTRSYLVFLYSPEHPTVMHLQMQPVPEGQEETAEPEPLTIEATNWDRAMKVAYRKFAPDGGAIGIAVCPVRNFRNHVVSEKPREAPSNSIHFG